METFQPKDTLPEWEKVYQHLTGLPVGSVVTFDDLTAVLGRDFLSARGPFYKANRKLLESHRLGLASVPKVGYQVVTAAEHEGLARRHHVRARRQLRRSLSWAENTDRSELEPEQVKRLDAVETGLRQQIDFTRRLETRVTRIEKVLSTSGIESTVDTAAKVDKLTEALARHGIKID